MTANTLFVTCHRIIVFYSMNLYSNIDIGNVSKTCFKNLLKTMIHWKIVALPRQMAKKYMFSYKQTHAF